MSSSAFAAACVAGIVVTAHADTRPGQVDDRGRFVPFVQVDGEQEFTGSLIVKVRPGLSAPDDRAARDLMLAHGARYNAKVGYYIVDVPALRGDAAPGEPENAFAEALMTSGRFQYAVPNWMLYPLDTPNDTHYATQWHHPQMNCPGAWDRTHGDGDMILAFTDTGIDRGHPDLAAKIVSGYDAYNNIAEDDGGSIDDLNGHGTHVAGCAAALSNNARGVAGVNWNARIMMVRVSVDESGGALFEDLLEGAQWAIENGASIVSASYSGVSHDPIQDMGAYIHSIGGIYIWAAGNINLDHRNWDWQDVVVVGATTYGDAKASFSCYGRGVDLFAPGVDIGSTTRGGGYDWWDGTSMATPLVNAVAGMIWAENPSLTPRQVEQVLFETCKDLGAPGNDDYWGWGRVDAAAAIGAAGDGADCTADWNGDGEADVQDLTAFLNDWVARDTSADLNDDGKVNSQDVVAYLNAWGVGC